MVHSHLSEFEFGGRGDFSPLDFVTGSSLLPPPCVASTDEAAAGCVVAPILLQVFERAGVTTRWIVLGDPAPPNPPEMIKPGMLNNRLTILYMRLYGYNDKSSQEKVYIKTNLLLWVIL